MGGAMIVFYNPRSTTPGTQPLPLSLLSLAAVVEGRESWALVDGNVTDDPAGEILARLEEHERAVLAVTVMPGPQLSAAVPVCRRVKEVRPEVPVVWGGYFPSQHAEVVLAAPYVDFVVRSQGEGPFLQLLEWLRHGGALADIGSLSWRTPEGRVVNNPASPLMPVEDLPDPPYARVPMEHYLHRTYLGTRTIAYNSSFGCPFSCSFCAVVAMARRRWLAQSPVRMADTIGRLAAEYQVDAVQMHDMDFFISEDRAREFAERVAPLSLNWWALGRVDTLMHYRDATWLAMARSGLKMVFSGAESPSADVLTAMNKGGRSSGALPLELAARMRTYGVVPEFSFVIGSPPDPDQDLARTFEFIRRIKQVNPATEIVLYTYTPVPTDSSLYASAERLGFRFPTTLEEWASDRWRQTMLRRGEGIPWLDSEVRARVRNFERVLNAFYPTVTDRRLTGARRALLRAASAWRYALRVYSAPYELRALHRLMRYQRPETTGF
jgi:radical SAM superfamily enzyme YgiQ (UPF0313 family)